MAGYSPAFSYLPRNNRPFGRRFRPRGHRRPAAIVEPAEGVGDSSRSKRFQALTKLVPAHAAVGRRHQVAHQSRPGYVPDQAARAGEATSGLRGGFRSANRSNQPESSSASASDQGTAGSRRASHCGQLLLAQLLVVVGSGVELRHHRILRTAQQHGGSFQRLLRERVDKAVKLGLRHRDGTVPAPAGPSSRSRRSRPTPSRAPAPSCWRRRRSPATRARTRGSPRRLPHRQRGPHLPPQAPHELRRSRLKGRQGHQTWTGWAILTYNLDTLAAA
jgi:hypothetical protein